MSRTCPPSVVAVAVLAVVCCSSLAGCYDRSGSPTGAPSSTALHAQRKEVSRDLFESAVEALNRLDDYDESRADSAVEQVVRRLNESLESGYIDGVKGEPFTVEDGKVLRELVWLREAAQYAVGDATDALARAERLFDWTVRNIQIIDETPPATGHVDERLPYLPWHLMVLGRGSVLDRAWLFALLARQEGLDVVLLGKPDAKPGAAGEPMLAALVHDGHAYLFDARWGVAVPGPGGRGVADLKQVQADDKLLRALDLDDVDGPKYPLTADGAKQLTPYVDTSSLYVSPKFLRLESLLPGDSKLVLSINEDDLKRRVGEATGVAEVVAWPLRDERYAASRSKPAYDSLVILLQPFRTFTELLEPAAAAEIPRNSRLARSPIWEARVKHLAGKYVDPLSGNATLARLYQDSRPSAEDMKKIGSDSSLWNYFYRVRQNATYWLGLVSYDLGNYETAVRYFEIILAEQANGGWTAGARFNLGRTLEALASPEKAAETYRATYFDVKPDAACLYRAKRIADAKAPSPKSEPGT